MAIAYRSGSTAGNASGGNLTITKPTNTADGDILVAVLYREAGSWTNFAALGFTQWGADFRDADSNIYISVVWKRASSEPANYTFNLDTTTWRSIAMGAFSGCLSSGDPLDAGPAGNNSAFAQVDAASISTTVANTMVICVTGNFDGNDVSVGASGYSQGAELGGTEIWYIPKAGTGATGVISFGSNSSNDWATAHLALKPAVATKAMPIFHRRNNVWRKRF